jgi:hypothetical protein
MLSSNFMSNERPLTWRFSLVADTRVYYNVSKDFQAPNITALEICDSYLREGTVGRLISRTPNFTSPQVDLTRHAGPADKLVDSVLDCPRLASGISP